MAPREDHPDAAEGTGPLLGKGALGVADCVAAPVDVTKWATFREATEVSSATRAIDDAKLVGWAVAHHVAIDRWTGGAADGLLYTTLEPGTVEWGPLRITVDLDRVAEERRGAAVALALLVLDDLGCGRLPLGFATNRGFGSLRVNRVELTTTGFEPAIGVDLEGGQVLAALAADARNTLAEQWAAEVLR